MVLDRQAVVSWYRRNRERSRTLFNLLTDDAYYSQPIALRHPIVFYEGHLPAFSFNTLVKRGLGCAGIDVRLETLFARVLDALAHADIERAGSPLLDRAEAVFAVLEHEAMHQETLLYMWHRLPLDQKKRPADYAPVADGHVPAAEWAAVTEGT